MNRLKIATYTTIAALMLTIYSTGCGYMAGMKETITQDQAAEKVQEHIDGIMSSLPEEAELVTVQVSRRRLRRFRASSTGPGPDRPERRTYRCRAWQRALHRNAPRNTTR